MRVIEENVQKLINYLGEDISHPDDIKADGWLKLKKIEKFKKEELAKVRRRMFVDLERNFIGKKEKLVGEKFEDFLIDNFAAKGGGAHFKQTNDPNYNSAFSDVMFGKEGAGAEVYSVKWSSAGIEKGNWGKMMGDNVGSPAGWLLNATVFGGYSKSEKEMRVATEEITKLANMKALIEYIGKKKKEFDGKWPQNKYGFIWGHAKKDEDTGIVTLWIRRTIPVGPETILKRVYEEFHIVKGGGGKNPLRLETKVGSRAKRIFDAEHDVFYKFVSEPEEEEVSKLKDELKDKVIPEPYDDIEDAKSDIEKIMDKF